MSEALRLNSALTSLNLEDTGVGAKGADAIGDALHANWALKQLDMRSNGADVAQALEEANEKHAFMAKIQVW